MELILHCILVSVLVTVIQCQQQNVVFILLDDVGRNDIGYHGSAQIPTPNIDAIFLGGVGLETFYTQAVCTPTRSALNTGMYPIRTGLQGEPIYAGQAKYLPTSFTTMAESFKGLGYKTHAVGKWHLGSKFRNVTPTYQGFDTFFGYTNGFCGYWDYQIQDKFPGYNGFNLYDNFRPAKEYANQIYATDLFTNKAIEIIQNHDKSAPLFLMLNHLAAHAGRNGTLEAKDPIAANEKYWYIVNEGRRQYAAILNDLDTAIGKVVKALQTADLLKNTILVLMSDNGAQTYGVFQNFGSNWPARGQKSTLFEGGVRNFAAIWSPNLYKKKYAEFTVVHVTDLYPTLFSAAGGQVSTLGPIDGIDHWPLFSTGVPIIRDKPILLNWDDIMKYGAILSKNGLFKLIQGSFNYGVYDSHCGDSGRNITVDPSYDIPAVLNSAANIAINAATNYASPLTEAEIKSIRSQVDIYQSSSATSILSCKLFNGYCFFNLQKDPRELDDVKALYPDEFNSLKTELESYKIQAVPQGSSAIESASNPAYCNNVWFNWGETDPALRCVS